MAYHVEFEVPRRRLQSANIRFKVRRNGQTLGELGISQGGLEWWPRRKQKSVRIDWRRLDEILANGRARTRR